MQKAIAYMRNLRDKIIGINTNKKEGGQAIIAAPLEIIFHQRRQLRENIGHPPPELFIIPLESSDLLWVHTKVLAWTAT